MSKLKFVFCVHNHQPSDNFEKVFNKAFKLAYKPFIDIVRQFPEIKISVHYSGSLLEWLVCNKPDFIQKLKHLIDQKQLSILTGGYYEPILTSINRKDRIYQLTKMTSLIKQHFNFSPKGSWTTERVWSKDLSGLFKSLGLSYTILDENHVKNSNVGQDHAGLFSLPDGFKVFINRKTLRYIIPFGLICDIERYFEHFINLQKASDKDLCIVFADDGEKFGLWPHTYNWVYRRKWLKRFFNFLMKNKDRIEMITFDEAVETISPDSIADLPDSTYSELEQWSGGNFNNFYSKYPESDLLRKRVAHLSSKIAECENSKYPGNTIDLARDELAKSQQGCVFWHGIFGGIYFRHLREGVYKHLIAAENLLDRCKKKVQKISIEGFGNNNEYLMKNKSLSLYMNFNNFGTLFGLEDREKKYNLVNLMTRKPEPYHDKLFKFGKMRKEAIKVCLEKKRFIDIHKLLGVKDRGLKKILKYDASRKESFNEYLFFGKKRLDKIDLNDESVRKIAGPPDKIDKENTDRSGSFKVQTYIRGEEGNPVFLFSKEVVLLSDTKEFSVDYVLKNISSCGYKNASIIIESNWSLYSRAAKYCKNTNDLYLNDSNMSENIVYSITKKSDFCFFPVYSVNESEKGLVKYFQYTSLLNMVPINLNVDETLRFGIKVRIL